MNNLSVRTMLCAILLLTHINVTKAQNSPERIVQSFGDALSSWCSTDDIVYREKIDGLCSGSKKCRVEDKIHAEYQKGRGLTNYETFVLDSYMNMFQSLIPQSLNYQMTNIKVVGSDEMPDGTLTFVVADINVSGAIDKKVTDLFLVRNGKISGIYSHSSNLGFTHLNGSLINALRIGRYSSFSSFHNGFAIVANEAGNEGLIDTKGNVIIPCIWDHVYYFGGDFARGFNIDHNMGITYDLRADGKRTPLPRVKDFTDDGGTTFTSFREGYAVVFNHANPFNEGQKCGYLYENDQTYTVEYKFDNATRFCDGYACVECAGVGIIVDTSLNPILKDTDEYYICGTPNHGLIQVQDRITEKKGFINMEGRLVIPCIYDFVNTFSEGLCCVAFGDNYLYSTWGCINTNGEIVIPFIYDSLEGLWGAFKDGYIKAEKDGHETLLGINGKPLPGFTWENEEVYRIREGFVCFKKNEKYGFMNAKGEVVIPPIYDYATSFYEGIACVGKIDESGDNRYGGINTDGILVIPCVYEDTFYFEGGIALVEKDNQVGLIDVYGNSTFLPKQ